MQQNKEAVVTWDEGITLEDRRETQQVENEQKQDRHTMYELSDGVMKHKSKRGSITHKTYTIP